MFVLHCKVLLNVRFYVFWLFWHFRWYVGETRGFGALFGTFQLGGHFSMTMLKRARDWTDLLRLGPRVFTIESWFLSLMDVYDGC